MKYSPTRVAWASAEIYVFDVFTVDVARIKCRSTRPSDYIFSISGDIHCADEIAISVIETYLLISIAHVCYLSSVPASSDKQTFAGAPQARHSSAGSTSPDACGKSAEDATSGYFAEGRGYCNRDKAACSQQLSTCPRLLWVNRQRRRRRCFPRRYPPCHPSNRLPR